MQDLESLLIREVVTVTNGTSVTEVAALMTAQLKAGLSAAAASCVCLEAGSVVGVITQADLVALLGQAGLEHLTVGDILPPFLGPVHFSQGTTLAELGQQFCQRQATVLPVVDRQQHFLGLLTQERVLQVLVEFAHQVEDCPAPDLAAQSSLSGLLAGLDVEWEQHKACEKILETISGHIHALSLLSVTLQAVVTELHQFLQTERVVIHQFQPDRCVEGVVEALSPGWPSLLGLQRVSSNFAESVYAAYHEGRAQVVNDVFAAALTPDFITLLNQMQVQAFVAVPIAYENRLWGVLVLHDCVGPRSWHPFEVNLLQRVSELIAIALQTDQAQELQSMNTPARTASSGEPALLAILAQKALQASCLEPFLDEVVVCVAKALNLKYCGILELLPNRAVLRLQAGVGWPQNWVRQATLRADSRSQYGYTLSQGQPVAVEDLRLETRFSDTPFLHNQSIVSGVSALISGKEAPYGVLSVHVCYQRNFTQADIHLLQGVADIVSAVIRRHQIETELIQAAEAIQKSQQQYATLAQLAPIGIFTSDPNSNNLYVNDRWCQLTGLTPETGLGKGWQKAIYPEDWLFVSEGWQEAVQSQHPLRQEHRYQRPDGTVVWVYVQAVPEWDEAGELIGYLGVVTDISDRKEAEIALQTLNQKLEDKVQRRTKELNQTNARLRQEIAEREQAETALRESQWFLELVLDNVPQAVFWKDQNSIYIGCNRHFARHIGLTCKEAVVGLTDFDLPWGRTEATVFREQDQTIVTTNQPLLQIRETRHELDGSIHWLETNKMPLHDSQGQVMGVLGSYEDITARVLAEDALRESQHFAQAIADTSPGLLYIYDLQRRCNIYANQECLSTIGYSADALQHMGSNIISFLIHPEDVSRLSDYHQRLSNAQDGEFFEIEYRIHNASGQWQWLRSRSTVFSRDSAGRVKQIIGAALDMSDLKQAEAEILRALGREKELNVLKSRFISMASHELRTPLTTILGSTELLQYSSHKWPEKKKQRHFEQIKNTVHHMITLVNDVLLYSKVEVEHLAYSPLSFDPIPFCNDLVEELAMGESFPSRLVFDRPAPGEVTLDKHLLRQILVNLLSNALKYSPPESPVYFCMHRRPQAITLEIADQGIGIPAQDLPRLYQSFHRGSNVGSIPGTGLGLAIVKRAVDICQGTINVMSEESKGTLVTVNLPFKPL